MQTLYRILIAPLGLLAALLAAPFSRKLRAGIGMRVYRAPLADWVGQHPTLWIHCASGEFEYAKPLVVEWKRQHPEWKIFVTYFSPSYREAIERFAAVDSSAPLPLDLPGPMSSFVRQLKPTLVAIARTDLWPEMIFQCKLRKRPVILFSATRAKVRARDRALLILWRWLYNQLSEIYCTSALDRAQFEALGIRAPIEAIGDTRYDQVIARLKFPKPVKDGLKPNGEIPILVAGSTWALDEEALIQACRELVLNGQLRLVIVPHEPSPEHLNALETKLTAAGLGHHRYTQTSHDANASVLVVDAVGILAELYQWGDLAFVGGSFRGSVHSVMEPLACGLVTYVGPDHQNNREALTAKAIPLSQSPLHLVNVANSAAHLNELLKVYLASEPSHRSRFKSEIRQMIEKNSGATRTLVERLNAKLN